jgi:hypothetical protein
VQVVGAGAPPTIAFVEPGGRRIGPTAAPNAAFVDATTLYVRDPDTTSTYLLVDRPRPGRWRLEILPGSAPVRAVRSALPLPRVGIAAHVRAGRRGGRPTLVFHARGFAGRTVQFIDAARGARRLISSSARGRGRIRFTPADRGGRHRVTAVVLGPGGVPTGLSRHVANFRWSPRPPARPRHLRIRRRGFDRLLTWRGPATSRYEADVRVGDGRRFRLIATGRRHRLVVPLVPRGVGVAAAGADGGVSGPPG